MAKKNFKVLNPRLDPNFKGIFTQKTKESNNALKSFLTAAIGRKVERVTVAENEEPKNYFNQRGLSYDINCFFDDGTKAQIEMQGYDWDYDYGKRAEYYASRLISTALEIGEDWDKVPQAYQISVLNFRHDKSNENPIHHYTMIDPTDNAKLTDRLNVIFIELPKIPEIDENCDIKNLPSIVKWCKFLIEADNPEKRDLIARIAESEEGIMSAETTLDSISKDAWRWIIQGQIEGRERDIRSGIHAAERRGLAKGEHKKAIEIARNFLKMGLPREQVAQGVGLTLEELNSL